MPRRARRTHAPSFKAKVAMAALKGDKSLSELAELYDLHPNQIIAWRGQLIAGAANLFGGGSMGHESAPAIDVKRLHAKIGELALENDVLLHEISKVRQVNLKR